MKNFLLTLSAALLILGSAAGGTARAQNYYPDTAGMAAPSGDTLFTAEELDDLLAPIALYPDPLLAQVLPAATFIDQIDEAARYVRQYGRSARIGDQPWDISVKAVAHYPDVLFMMDQKYDWTAALGQAFINQQQDVMDAIQRLRAEAQSEGNLSSTPQQEVINSDGYISIVPAAADLIYVPQYDPQAVYFESSPPYGFITFGTGIAIGAWLNRDCDWRGRRVFYHGWQGGGWIGRARMYVHDRKNIYINSRYSAVNVSRFVLQHNTSNFRVDLRQSGQHTLKQVHPQESRIRAVQPGGGSGAGLPVNGALYRGRATGEPPTAAESGYGGYGSSRDVSAYRERGQASRATTGQFNRQLQVPAQGQHATPNQRRSTTQFRQPVPAQSARPTSHQTQQPANHGGGPEQQRR